MRLSERIYRLALRSCPAGFRKDYGETSVDDFRRLIDTTEQRRGKLAVTVLCCRAVVDLLRTSIYERRRAGATSSTKPGRGAFAANLRDAGRTLTASPGFTLLVILTLGLGIGANGAIFELVYEVLWKPLPFTEPAQLVTLQESDLEGGGDGDDVTPANFEDWRALNTSFEDIAALVATSMNFTGDDEPERLRVERVSSSLFPLLGVEPRLGRAFLAEEDTEGRGRVVVLSHGLWQRRFGGGDGVLGKSLRLDGESYRVVGVLPSWFRFPSRGIDLFVPLAMGAEERSSRNSHYLDVIGRLRSDISLARASSEMDAIGKQLETRYPDTNADNGVVVRSLHDELVGELGTPLLVLLAAVGAVLLIAVVNVANLLLARSAARRKEVAVRAALGASRARILGQLMTESAMLAGCGAVIGMLISVWAKQLLQVLTPEHVVLDTTWLHPATAVFATALSLAVALGMGLLPALQLSGFGHGPLSGLRSSASSAGARSRNVLVVAEVALAVALLSVGGLMLRSFASLTAIDPGFRAENVLTLRVELSGARYQEHHEKIAFYHELESRVSRLPGVVSSGFVTMLPLSFQGGSIMFAALDAELPVGIQPLAVFRSVSNDYFRTLGISLVEGRGFDRRDGADAPKVVVVNEQFVRDFFPDADVLGHRIDIWGTSAEIVGVVANLQQLVFGDEPRPSIYVAMEQRALGFFDPKDFAVRTQADPTALAPGIRAEIWAIDPDQPIASIRTMEQIVSGSIANRRMQTLLLFAFATVALLLATLGIYGVLSYLVSQRTDEIGLRMALGARALDVVRLVAGQGMLLALCGMAIGLVAGVGLGRVLSGMLHGVEAGDPWTLAAVACVLSVVAFAACLIPAARAARIDPLVALRND